MSNSILRIISTIDNTDNLVVVVVELTQEELAQEELTYEQITKYMNKCAAYACSHDLDLFEVSFNGYTMDRLIELIK